MVGKTCGSIKKEQTYNTTHASPIDRSSGKKREADVSRGAIAIRQEELGILPWIHVNNSLGSNSEPLSEEI